jgi:hypothetical protein
MLAFILAIFLPFTLINKSQTVDDDKVYILVKGINPTTHRHCYINLDQTTGKGSYADVQTGVNSFTYSYKFSSLPKDANGRAIYLPPLDSGRIYFSVGHPMDLLVDASGAAIKDPDALLASDSNYYTLYDKIEFTLNNSAIYINPTAVDFFSLPLLLRLQTSSGAQLSGFSQRRQAIFSQIRSMFAHDDKTPNHIWDNLIVSFRDPDTQASLTDLRIAATAKAMKADPSFFDINYLNNDNYGFNWMRQVWYGYYKTHTLSIDARELPAPNKPNIYG